MTFRMLQRITPTTSLAPIRTNAGAVALSLLAFACAAGAQSAALDTTALVHRAVQHRQDDAKNHRPLMYQLHRIDQRRDVIKEIVETQDGDVARLIAIDGKPLSFEANQAEIDRLNTLAQHPELEQRRRRSEQQDADRITHLLNLLPDALIYKFDGMARCGVGQCYRLSFIPNPRFTPPDLESNVLRGIAGEVWIDQEHERLTRLDGRFIADVDLGFGILGRLDRGGTVLLEQSDIGHDDWELTGLKIHVKGKVLMVKSYSYQVDEQTGHFSTVASDLHYRDAINLLKKLDPVATPYTP